MERLEDFQNFIDKIVTSANTSIMVGTHSWKQQFKEAIEFESEKGSFIYISEKFGGNSLTNSSAISFYS